MKRDGQMYGNLKPVDGDTGVAVYFTWDNDQYVLACDQYIYLQDNLRAIEKSIDALRGLKRWGASDILKRAFKGFKALGSGTDIKKREWWEVLGVSSNAHPEVSKGKYRELAKIYHPDVERTGDAERFKEINDAYNQSQNIL